MLTQSFLPGGLQQSDIVIERGVSMKTDEVTSAIIANKWEEAVSKNPRLFNKTKFRFDSCTQLVGGSMKEKEDCGGGHKLRLRLSITDYRDYLGTHCCTMEEFNSITSRGDDYMSKCLGCQCLVLTSDECIILMKRSENVSTFRGWYQVAGAGHPEPSRIGILNEEMISDTACEVLASNVCHNNA
jgi:hypothetical protein